MDGQSETNRDRDRLRQTDCRRQSNIDSHTKSQGQRHRLIDRDGDRDSGKNMIQTQEQE